MRILITGGAGFIGSHLVQYHLEKNDEVIAIDNLSTGNKENITQFLDHANFTFLEYNIHDMKDLRNVIEKIDRIYHMAAVVGMYNVIHHPLETLDVNLLSTEQLLSIASQQAKKPLVIIASTSEVYGSKKGEMRETDPLTIETTEKNHTSYPISKLCNEVYALSYFKMKKLPVIVTRIFNTIGPRQTGRYGMVVPRFVKQAKNHEDIVIYDSGNQTRSFCDVRDLINLLDALANEKASYGQVINVGNDMEISINELANLIKKLAKSHSKLCYISYQQAYGDEYIAIENRKPDLTRLKKLINYRYQWNLEKTIVDLLKS